MRCRPPLLFLPLIVGACTQPGGPAPSLAPRAAETIDPRLPIGDRTVPGTVDPVLAAQLEALVAQARAGDAAFEEAAATAERLVSVAGPRLSESWVVAQEALSVAVAARGPTARAVGEIDELAAAAIAERGWVPPADLAAIAAAAARVSEMAAVQGARVAALRARLAG